MGYFWRGIDRKRSRKAKDAVRQRAAPELPWKSVSRQPPRSGHWVRFSTLLRHENSGRRTGFFQATYDELQREDLDPHVRAGMRQALDWFEQHLHARDVGERRAIWCFKSRARKCMQFAWELIHWLREAGVVVEMQVVPESTGRICYEDAHQVAIVPHRDSSVR